MKKENITEIRFNIYDGSRSDIPSVYTDTTHKSFGYGERFGHDGSAFWIDLNESLDDFEDDVEEEDRKYYEIIREVIEDNF
jgi:hypothetical protein